MVLTLEGNSEKGTHVFGYLICVMHFLRLRAVTFRFFFIRKDLFPYMRAQHVLSYNIIYVPGEMMSYFRYFEPLMPSRNILIE